MCICTCYFLQITPPLITDYEEPIDSLYLNRYFGRYVLANLKHETHYQFTLVVANYAGNSSYFAEVNTTIGEQATFIQLAFHVLCMLYNTV